MSPLDHESDDRIPQRETEPAARPTDEWRRPLLLAALGLVLMIGGYKATTYVPLTPRQIEQERQFGELRDLAARQQEEPMPDGSLSERLHQVAPPWRSPPYQVPGRLALWGGLFLFITAGLLMYRHSPAPKNEPAEETPEHD
jgi:hypothetical protein